MTEQTVGSTEHRQRFPTGGASISNSTNLRGRILSSGILLGAGLGGFIDGIALHQLLQWHNMLSSVRPPTDLAAMKYNMLWDGVFHLFAWSITVVGLVRLWSATKWGHDASSTRCLVGALLMGWGAFNLVEGVIDHFILAIHHVHPGANELAWDIAFAIFGALQLAVGLVIAQRRSGTVVQT